MTTSAPNIPATSVIHDLYRLVLVDGIKLHADGREITYKVVRLRETNVADERAAQLMAERCVIVGGQPKLLVSDAEFRYAMTLKHIESLECDGVKIPAQMIDLDMLGKFSSHDLGKIEERVYLVELAAQVRYGAISQEQFDAIVAGQAEVDEAPQHAGPAESVGQAPAAAQPVPALLADHSGTYANGAAAGHGG